MPLAAAAVVLASGAAYLAPISTRDYLVRDESVVRIDDARTAAMRDAFPMRGRERQFLEGGEGNDMVEEEGDEGAGKEGDDRAEEKRYDMVEEREFLVEDWKVAVLWRNGEKGNVLTRENVAEMKRREDEFEKSKRYGDFCWRDVNANKDCVGKVPACAPVKSITRHPRLYGVQVRGIPCGVREGHDVVSEEDWDAFLKDISVEAQAGNGERAILQPIGQLIGKEANRTVVPQSWVAMSVFQFGAPLRGFGAANRADLAKGVGREQVEMYRDWVVRPLNEFKNPTSSADVKLDALAMGWNYAEVLIHKQIWKDLMFAAVSIGTVGLLMWLHTGSLFLSLATLLQVALSFPLGYFVYRFLAQVKFFSALHILTVFLIIGIGADDCFIFVDAWKQSTVALGEDCDQVKRLTWTCGRAFKAMTVTSLTTALAFLFTATNPVLPVATLGIWAGILVLVQFLLVLTMYPSVIIICDNMKSKKLRGIAKKPADESKNSTEKCLEPAIDGEDLSTFNESCGDDDLADIEKAGSCSYIEDSTSDDEKEFRVVERFFHYRWSAWIHKLRWVLLAIGAAVTGVSVFLATHLKPLSDEEAYWRSEHPLSVAPDLLKNEFLVDDYSGKYFIHTAVFWGVKKIENSGLSRYDLQSIGDPVYDGSFDLKPASAQKHMLTVCNSIEKNEALLPQINLGPRADCWISDFRKWRMAEKSANESELDGFTSYADDQELVTDLKMFLKWTNKTAVGQARFPHMKHLRERSIAFSEDGSRVIYSELRFFTDVEKSKPWAVVWPMYEKWQETMKDLQKDAPPSVRNGLMTGGHGWMWAATTRILFLQAFRGVGIMLGVAFVVLMVSTANIVTAFLTTLSIGGITANLLGILSAAGFEGKSDCSVGNFSINSQSSSNATRASTNCVFPCS